ncbi:MAG: BlaI/MecI/CopY family transcriptional regulator [Gemmatimonadaceae bacterium]
MPKQPPLNLSRRERQILEVIYRLGRATAAEVTADLPDAPTLTTVRGLLRILKNKGHIQQEYDGPRYVYAPAVSRGAAGSSMLSHVVRTFFNDSPANAMAALLGSAGSKLNDEELNRLAKLVEHAKKKVR